MNISHQLLFFFSALGAFNSSLLSIYFFFLAKPKNTSNYMLGGLLTVLSIRVWKSIFFYFNPDLSKLYLQIGLSACFFIGPMLFLFIKSKQVNTKSNIHSYQLVVLGGIILLVGFFYPYEYYPELWGDIFYKIINYQWLAYILLSTWSIKNTLNKFIYKQPKFDDTEVWVLSVYAGITLIWLSYFFASYTSYIMGALSFSFALYLSVLLIYLHRKQKFIAVERKEKYAGNKIEAKQADLLLQDIEKLLIEQELFKHPDLTLAELAKKMNIRPHLLSQLLNDNLHKSFSSFINEYRIEEAKKLLNTHRNLKMEVIAEMCGFNSKSTFYNAFKKATNTTPAKFQSYFY